uniref:Uncharacterized protein n=1 Tax=viral metagenome TaxID=1070528 RepID=A0A6M3JP34_9ZZZZ
MTIFTPTGKVGEIEKACCAGRINGRVCDNDTFEAYITLTARGSSKIKSIKCAMCGEETIFTPAPPEEFN